MEILKIVLLLLTAHVFGDYVFQSQYLAETKSNNLYHLFIHCWIYTFMFWIALSYLNKADIWGVSFVFASHILIDYIKGKSRLKQPNKAGKYYIFDQLFHYLVIIILTLWII